MRKVAVRGMFSRKLRMSLTALSVALGVCLIAGTYVFTDTINHSFDTIFSESAKGTDAAITPRKPIDTSQNGGTQPVLPRSLLAKVRQNTDVQDAQGSVFDVATVLGKDGKRVGLGGAPNFVASVAEVPRFDGFTVKVGRKPRTADEATIDAATAEKENFKVGDKVSVVGEAPRKAYTIVGTTQIAGVDSFGGATVVDLTLPEALRMLGKDGYDQIQASAKPGVTPEQLRDSLRQDVGRQAVVRTGQEEARNQAGDIQDSLGFLTTALLAFAGISLFVGAFIIFNTFSITVTQRMREFALLRTLGASRGQVMRSVITEGLLLGVIGSLVGLALGMAIAPGLRALFRAVGVDLPSTGNVVETRTIVVSLVVGTLVSVLAGLAPGAARHPRAAGGRAARGRRAVVARSVAEGHRSPAPLLALLGLGLMAAGLFGSLSRRTRR